MVRHPRCVFITMLVICDVYRRTQLFGLVDALLYHLLQLHVSARAAIFRLIFDYKHIYGAILKCNGTAVWRGGVVCYGNYSRICAIYICVLTC